MWEPVDVACHRCRITLPLLDAPVPREAWWKFLYEHAYHPVELMWEHSEAHERIDIDYVEVNSDIRSDPSFAEYAGEWTGRALALHPRPVARAVAGIVRRAQDAMDAHEWRAAPADAVVAERLVRSMDFAPPPGETVDDAAVLARLATVEATLERLRRAAAEPLGEHFGTLLNDLLSALPTPADLPPDELRAESGPLASPRLWDTERALRLIQHLLWSITHRSA
ncbi:hypothetical protein EDD90_7453 [Streptomyces sp. Ag109_O5-1]|uniref:hypothetical protein n=1 Tax=Streptomyces sp. Ag109_O5-1 TaxID=1938851 RepID=UPI000F4E7BD2|nr:hypothetical protein [Streptomyces sp. Ag109_O5-1]RPE44218.1 hypothetical protein EDD90_7453 [Streptomyces sp. Ag109_O5-1]